MTALDDLLKKTGKAQTSPPSGAKSSGGDLNALLSQVKSGKYQAPNSGYVTGTPPPAVAGTSTQSPAQPPQQNAIGSFLTGVTQLAQKYIPQFNPSTAPQPLTPATFQNPNQISNQVLGPNQPINPINPQLFNESPQSITSAQPVATPESIPKPLDFSQTAQSKLRSTMYDVGAAAKKAEQTTAQALSSAREWLNKNIGDIQVITKGEPVPLEKVGNTDKNASPYFAFRNQQDLLDFADSPIARVNHTVNFLTGKMSAGLTGGILKPSSEAPRNLGEKIFAQIAETAGSVYSLNKIGKVIEGLTAGSETIGKFIENYPTVSKYLVPFAKGAATLDIYGQLDPDIKNRFQKLLTDTAIAIPLAALGTQGKAFSMPASFGMGYALSKLNGADNADAIIAGSIFSVLDGAGKLGERNMIDKAMADRVVKTEARNILNEYAEKPLTKNSSEREITDVWKKILQNEHPDKGGNSKKFVIVKEAYEYLTGKTISTEFLKMKGLIFDEKPTEITDKSRLLTDGEIKPTEIVKTESAPQEKSTFTYTPDTKLSTEEKAVEKKFGDYLAKNLPEAEKTYTEKFGNVLNTDNARELSPDYNANRSALSPAVHEPASAFIKQLYEKQLTQPAPEGKLDKVLFTAGGTGAGKTTALSTKPEFKNSVDTSQIVYDTNLSSFDSSKEKIDQALAADKNVQIVYVSRDPVDAMMNGAVPRAVRMGRTVPVDVHVGTHIKSLQTIQKLEYLYKDNPQVQIRVIDNSHGKGNAVEVPIDSLKNISYDKASLTDKIRNELKTQYEQGKISKDIYQGFTGEKPTSGVSQVSKPNDQSNGQKPQQPHEKQVDKFTYKLPKKIYRGIGISSSGSGTSNLGKGLYTTTDKAIAKTYAGKSGQLTEPDPLTSLPKHPIEFRNQDYFDTWLIEKIQAKGYKRLSEFQNDGNSVEGLVQSFGYDGVKVGAGNGYNFVKYEKPVEIKKEVSTAKPLEKKVVSIPENKQPKTAEIPHKEGYSRFQERLQGQLLASDPGKYELDPKTEKYNQITLKGDAKNALHMLEHDPERAMRIAKGFEAPPKSTQEGTLNGITLAVALKAKAEGNYTLWGDLIGKTTQRSTAFGQNISVLKGQFNADTPENYVKRVLNDRINRLGKNLVSETEKAVGFKKQANVSVETKVTEIVDREVEKLSKQMKVERSRIRLAQDIIDSLTCK